MKKFLVAIVAVLFAAPSFAQYSSGGFSLSESTVYYGARVGLNVGWISGDVDGYGAKAGMNIGGVLGLRVSDATPVFLESGLYFAMQGAKDGKGVAGKIKPGSTGSFSSDGGFNRPDVGIKFGCGAEYNKLYLETGLKFGVTNILDDDNDAAHNGAWYLNFGVNF